MTSYRYADRASGMWAYTATSNTIAMTPGNSVYAVPPGSQIERVSVDQDGMHVAGLAKLSDMMQLPADEAAEWFDVFARNDVRPPVKAWSELAATVRLVDRLSKEYEHAIRELEQTREHAHMQRQELDARERELADYAATRARLLANADRCVAVHKHRISEIGNAVHSDSLMTSEQWSAQLRAKVKASDDARKAKEARVVIEHDWYYDE